jgi:hypothetical protein
MKNQLYKFTTKWYGDYIEKETDLCSFTLKTIYAMVKFALIASLVLQPLVFGPLGWYLRVLNIPVEFGYAWYLVINMMAFTIGTLFVLGFLCLEWIPNTVRGIIYNLTCSKKITFEEDD